MAEFDPLPPWEAAERFQKDPDSIRILLPDLASGFGLTLDELVDELQSGRLVASVDGTDGTVEQFQEKLNRNEVYCTGGAVARWMEATGRYGPGKDSRDAN